MGLFDRLRRRKPPAECLLPDLIDAFTRQDARKFSNICRDNEDRIRELFPEWRKPPEVMRDDPEALNTYAGTLLNIARLFERAGDRSLTESLQGDDADNPLVLWNRELEREQSNIDNDLPQEAVELLETLLEKYDNLKGSGADYNRPRTYGMLGVACFRAGEKERAEELTQKAMAMCEAIGDEKGVAVYRNNLQLIRDGATVVFRDPEGRPLTRADIHGRTGPVRYEIVGTGRVPPEARELHQTARRAGGRGEYDRAVALLEQAASAAPDWPYPVYDLAFTYLLMDDIDGAARCYEKTVEMAPRGFFTAITAADTLAREQNGDLPPGTYRKYLSLEWMENREEKTAALRQFTEDVPHFAPAWKDLAAVTNDETERRIAVDNGLAANPDTETEGQLLIQKASLLESQGYRDRAIEILGLLALNPESTLATEHLAKSMLATMTSV